MLYTLRIATLVALAATLATPPGHAAGSPALQQQQQQPVFRSGQVAPAESNPTPEPSTWALLAVAVLSLGFAIRHHSRRRSPAS